LITITKVETIDEAAYNFIHCPQCNHRLGWKPKGASVGIFRLSHKPKDRFKSLGLTCKRCKSNFLLTNEE
jgi:DNA-directed RNA polymerase subunit RPC12/RpoP